MIQSPAELAEAIAELEAYDDDEHAAALEFVRAILDLAAPPFIDSRSVVD